MKIPLIDIKYTDEVWKQNTKESWNLGLYIEKLKGLKPQPRAKIRLLNKLHDGMAFWCWRNMPKWRDYTLEELDKKGFLNMWKKESSVKTDRRT